MTEIQTLETKSIFILLLFLGYLLLKIRKTIKKHENRTLLNKNNTLKKLKQLEWHTFESLCKELYIKKGWKVLGSEKKGADGGVDLWMKRRGKSAIVQCKKYDEARVTIKVAREMYGLMHEHDVDQSYIVTTSVFTKECYKFIEGKNIELVNGEELVKIIKKIT